MVLDRRDELQSMETHNPPDPSEPAEASAGAGCSDEKSQQLLHALQELAQVGLWELRLPDKYIGMSQEACGIIGIGGDGFSGPLEMLLPFVHADDRQRLRARLEQASQQKISLDGEYRIMRPDGELRYVYLRSRWTRDETGDLLFGTVQEITEHKRTQKAIRESEERFKIVAKVTNDAIWDWHVPANRVWWNEGIRSLFGFSHQEIETGIEWWVNRIHPEDRDSAWRKLHAAMDGHDEQWSYEYRFMRKDGSYADVLDRGYFIRGSDGKAIRMIGAMLDITERKRAEARLREQASWLDKAKDAITVAGMDTRFTYWNKGAERLFGWTAEEALGKTRAELIIDDPARFNEAIYRVGQEGDWTGEIRKRRKDGTTIMVETHWTLVRDEKGRPQSVLALDSDITRRKEAEREIEQLAFFDTLTLLPNRRLLLDRLQHALATCGRSGHNGALLFIDLDNFKSLNDTLGHDKGDMLLKEVAQRLETCARKSNTVARLGGDEFVVMLEDLSAKPEEAAAQAEIVAEKILAVFNQPFDLAGHEYHTTPSIGVTLFDCRVDNVDDLLKRGDLAMYQAKAAGRNTVRFFDPDMQTVVTARVALETDLRQGLQLREFSLNYQRQADTSGRTIGVEALVRWQHPRRGMVSPALFIPLAEETGMIVRLGQWVLETACRQLAVWAASPRTSHLTVAVNVSARQFRSPDFVDQVAAILELTGANPQNLKLELTESMLVENVENTIAKMTALQATGVTFALDDFGTGYSSLSYLKRLPLDQLKIDRSFVKDVLTNANDAAIARTIVALGKTLGLHVIAEGVETTDQRDFLAEQGCHAYQGYLISRPLTAEEFAEI
jgi:diguanylate cyclase (GGDEF)-like protein/PAS domain S-box-containing protein